MNQVFDNSPWVPVDKTAAMLHAKGEKAKGAREITGCLRWEICPKLDKKYQPLEDLTGIQVGRFTVIGPHFKVGKGPRGWVVRCTCGMYEIRRHSSIKNPNNSLDRCRDCRKIEDTKRSHFFRTHGYDRS